MPGLLQTPHPCMFPHVVATFAEVVHLEFPSTFLFLSLHQTTWSVFTNQSLCCVSRKTIYSSPTHTHRTHIWFDIWSHEVERKGPKFYKLLHSHYAIHAWVVMQRDSILRSQKEQADSVVHLMFYLQPGRFEFYTVDYPVFRCNLLC